jgi:hypothetical protein
VVDRLLLDQVGYVTPQTGATVSVSTPDHADFAITGDIDIRALVAANDWTPAGTQVVMSAGYTAPDRSWEVELRDTGFLAIVWSEDGSLNKSSISTVAPTVSDGGPLWIRFTLDVDNGAAGRDVKFYTSTDAITTAPASVSWTQLGTTVTTAGVTSIHNSSDLPTIGAPGSGASGIDGKVYYAEVRNGIAGTVVTNPDFRDADQQTSGTTLTDDFSKVWTVSGSAVWTLPGATDSYQLEDGSGVILLESSTADVFVPYRNPMPPLIAQ